MISEINHFLGSASFQNLFTTPPTWDSFTNLGVVSYKFFDVPYMFPEPLILLNYYLDVFPLDEPSLGNSYLIFRTVGFSVGMFLLVSFLTKNNLVGFFVLVSCLFSNLLTSNLQIGTIHLIFWYPYLFYFLLLWLERGHTLSFLITVIMFDIAVIMHYPEEPVYLLLIFVASYGFMKYGPTGLVHKIWSIFPKPRVVVIALIMTAFVFSPRIYQYLDLNNMVAARSGFTQGIKPDRYEVEGIKQLHNQHPAKLSDYITMSLGKPYLMRHSRHGVWNYAGPFVLFFAILSLILGYNTDKRKIIFSLFSSAVMIGIISFGSKTPLFLLTDGIPLLNQGSSPLYHVSSGFFLLVIMSGYGLLLFTQALYRRLFWQGMFISAFSLSYTTFGLYKQNMTIAVAGMSIMVLLFVARHTINSGRFKVRNLSNAVVSLIITLTIFQLIPFQTKLVEELGKPYMSLSAVPFYVPTERNHIVNPSLSEFEGKVNTSIFSGIWARLSKEPTIGTSVTAFSGTYTIRTNKLINLLYPGRKNIETLKEDISRTVYNHREPILGYDFPIFFFVPHAEVIPKAIVQNEARLSRTLMRMADYYKRGNPENVFFFEGDDMPPKLSKAVASTEFSGIVEVSIDQERSTPHEVFGKVNAPQDGYIVRLENYHSDWNIRIDGEKERIYYGNYAFQAFPISKGNHELHWTFDTPFPMFFLMYQFAFYTGFVLFIWYGYRYGSHSNSNRLPPHSE